VTDTPSQRLRLLRRVGRDLTHEIKNQLGVAMGFLDLVQDGIDGDLPKKDLDRALRALSELDLLVTEAQLALRREVGSAESSDLVSVLQQSLEDHARLPGGEGGRSDPVSQTLRCTSTIQRNSSAN